MSVHCTLIHLLCHGGVEEVSGLSMNNALRLSSAAGRVEHKQNVLTV